MIRRLVVYAIAVVCLFGSQVNASQHSVLAVKESIVKHSLAMGVDPALALSIAKSESGFRHEARSSHGAVGVFQLMPSTAKKLGVNPYYLSDNIKGGLMYYKKMYRMFGSTELALAAYNAGPGTVRRYKRIPPIRETKKFVSNIMAEYHRQKSNPDPAIVKIRKLNTAKNLKQAIHKVIPKQVVRKKVEIKVPVPQAKLPVQGIV